MTRSLPILAAITTMACSPGAENAATAVAHSEQAISQIALGDQHVYFVAVHPPHTGIGRFVRKVPRRGGAVEEIALGDTIVRAIAASGATLYVAAGGDGRGSDEILRVDADTAMASRITFARGAVGSLVADGDTVFWTASAGLYRFTSGDVAAQQLLAEGAGPAIAIDSGHVYSIARTVVRVPRAGGPAEHLAKIEASTPRFPEPIAVGDRAVFWYDMDSDSIHWCNKTAGPASAFASPTPSATGSGINGDTPSELAIGGDRLWFTSSNGGLWYAPADGGGSPVRHIRSKSSDTSMQPVAADAREVYFSSGYELLRVSVR